MGIILKILDEIQKMCWLRVVPAFNLSFDFCSYSIVWFTTHPIARVKSNKNVVLRCIVKSWKIYSCLQYRILLLMIVRRCTYARFVDMEKYSCISMRKDSIVLNCNWTEDRTRETIEIQMNSSIRYVEFNMNENATRIVFYFQMHNLDKFERLLKSKISSEKSIIDELLLHRNFEFRSKR